MSTIVEIFNFSRSCIAIFLTPFTSVANLSSLLKRNNRHPTNADLFHECVCVFVRLKAVHVRGVHTHRFRQPWTEWEQNTNCEWRQLKHCLFVKFKRATPSPYAHNWILCVGFPIRFFFSYFCFTIRRLLVALTKCRIVEVVRLLTVAISYWSDRIFRDRKTETKNESNLHACAIFMRRISEFSLAFMSIWRCARRFNAQNCDIVKPSQRLN